MAKNCTLCGGKLYSFIGGNLYTLFYHSHKYIILKKDSCFLIKKLMDRIYKIISSETPSRIIDTSPLLYSLLFEINNFANRNTTNYFESKINKLKPSIEFIQNNYKKDISLRDLSRTINVSESYFCRLFKMVYKKSPNEFLTEYRIQMAKDNIINNQMLKIKDIAILSGFNDVSYFIYIFKKYENITPQEFKRKTLGDM